MESWTVVTWFFLITGLVSLAIAVGRVLPGRGKKRTPKERREMLLLLCWVAVSAAVVYVGCTGGSGYVYPRAWENV